MDLIQADQMDHHSSSLTPLRIFDHVLLEHGGLTHFGIDSSGFRAGLDFGPRLVKYAITDISISIIYYRRIYLSCSREPHEYFLICELLRCQEPLLHEYK